MRQMSRSCKPPRMTECPGSGAERTAAWVASWIKAETACSLSRQLVFWAAVKAERRA